MMMKEVARGVAADKQFLVAEVVVGEGVVGFFDVVSPVVVFIVAAATVLVFSVATVVGVVNDVGDDICDDICDDVGDDGVVGVEGDTVDVSSLAWQKISGGSEIV